MFPKTSPKEQEGSSRGVGRAQEGKEEGRKRQFC
jgi:hypothetical protein